MPERMHNGGICAIRDGVQMLSAKSYLCRSRNCFRKPSSSKPFCSGSDVFIGVIEILLPCRISAWDHARTTLADASLPFECLLPGTEGQDRRGSEVTPKRWKLLTLEMITTIGLTSLDV